MGLGLFAAISAGAGALLAKDAKAEPVKAADGDWLACSVLDLTASGTKIPTYPGFNEDSILFKCWNSSDYSASVKEFSMHKTGINNIYTVICKFSASDSFDKVQFRYTESSGDKYSEAYSYSLNSETTNKVIRGVNWQNGWHDSTWDLALEWSENPYFKSGSYTYSMLPDVDNCRYIAEEKAINSGEYSNFFFIHNTDGYCTMLDDTSLDTYYSGWGTTWMTAKVTGTFDIILDNKYTDNGVVRLREYEDGEDTYIYYITETTDVTPNNIYTYGGSEQFGEWPGKAITSVTGVEDVFADGVIHFEGVDQKIYKIPLKTGYPGGDKGVIFNYNGDESKTQNNILVPKAGYYFSETIPDNYVIPAGKAIEFILMAEEIRNAVEASGDIKQYSVCGISEDDAKDICDAYNLLDNTAKQYVVRTEALTYKRDGSDGNEMVAYKYILIELSKKCEVDVGLSPRIEPFFESTSGSSMTLIAAVSIIAIASISTVAVLVVIKKRKHE